MHVQPACWLSRSPGLLAVYMSQYAQPARAACLLSRSLGLLADHSLHVVHKLRNCVVSRLIGALRSYQIDINHILLVSGYPLDITEALTLVSVF